MKRRILAATLLLGAIAALPGCGYALAGRGSFLPSYIRTIGIPTFTNRTTIFNLETLLTDKVRAEFIGRGKYQILPQATDGARRSGIAVYDSRPLGLKLLEQSPQRDDGQDACHDNGEKLEHSRNPFAKCRRDGLL